MNVFNQLSPQINALSMSPFFEKKTKSSPTITSHSSSTTRIYRRLIQEMNNNPEYVMKFLKQDHRLDSSILISQIEKEIKVGIIKPINQKQLLIDIFSLTVLNVS
jgi:hypothetical protein